MRWRFLTFKQVNGMLKVFGGPSTGKTQLCHSAVALCSLSGGKVHVKFFLYSLVKLRLST